MRRILSKHYHNSDANNDIYVFFSNMHPKSHGDRLVFSSLECINQMTDRGFANLHHVQFQFYLNPSLK